MDERSPEMLKSTLIAGLVFGTLGALPFFNFINCFCCALIVACGFFASYLYSGECRRSRAEFRPGNGAIIGLVAGAFYAMATTLVGAVVQLLIGDRVSRMILEWMMSMPNLPAESREMLEKALEESGTLSVVKIVMQFFLMLLFGAIFSTIGGLIGGAVFKVAAPPPSPAPSLPPDDYAPPPPSAPAV